MLEEVMVVIVRECSGFFSYQSNENIQEDDKDVHSLEGTLWPAHQSPNNGLLCNEKNSILKNNNIEGQASANRAMTHDNSTISYLP